MSKIPHDGALDSTLAFRRDPYRFVAKQCRRLDSDLFQTRLLFRKTICMKGPQAAELFYHPDRFVRHGAMPGRIQKTLFGKGGVQGLDGEEHLRRKEMFMSLMSAENIRRLSALSALRWSNYSEKWAASGEIELYCEACKLLTETVCAWAGVPLPDRELERRTHQLSALFDYAGNVGPRHWWSRLSRKLANRWIEDVVRQIRSGQILPEEQSASSPIAWHRDRRGQLLPAHDAAVEIINVLRPTVAVAVYFVFVAHALHEYPECRERLQSGESDYSELFVQEVRRFYPFFPSVIARVRQRFDWNGYHFPKGRSVLLDLYGTNHDARAWQAPEAFQPERFRTWNGSAFNFVPQGGGDHRHNHRCPGEWIAIELMKVAADFLARRMQYSVPPQDLRLDFMRLPALPASRFRLKVFGISGKPFPNQVQSP